MSSLNTGAPRGRARSETPKNFRKAVWGSFQNTKSLHSLTAVLMMIEFAAIVVVAYLAVLSYHSMMGMPWSLGSHLKYLYAAFFLSATVLLLSLTFHNSSYIQTRPLYIVLGSAISIVALAFSFLLSGMFLFKLTDEYSRGSFVFQLVGVSIVVLGGRTIFYFRIRSAIASGFLEARRVFLIGNPDRCAQMSERVEPNGIRVVGSFSPPDASDHIVASGREREARLMVDKCRSLKIEDIFILADDEDWPRTVKLVNLLSELPLSLHIVPSSSDTFFSTSQIVDFGGVTTIQVACPPLSALDRATKRAFDVCVAASGLLLLAPLFVIVSIAIKLDSRGPVFFRQARIGFNKEPILVFKFRSMSVTETDGEFVKQAERNDPRVTRIGRILRRTNVDELPQLLNVLRGEMSIIGPRPHAIAHNKLFEELIPPYSRRHRMKPGISGWAQVHGYRGETDTIQKLQRRLEYDLYYIDNWSVWFDMKIIFLTLFSTKSYVNAY